MLFQREFAFIQVFFYLLKVIYLQAYILTDLVQLGLLYKHFCNLFDQKASRLSPHYNENCVKEFSTPFYFDQLPTQVQKSTYWLKGLESAIIFAPFLGLAHTEPFVSKSPNNFKFLFKSIGKLNFKLSKLLNFKSFSLLGT